MDNKLLQEKTELSRIIGEGIKFYIEEETIEPKTISYGLFGLLKKKTTEVVKKRYDFKIEEPTLGTLDRMSREWIELAIEDESMQGMELIDKAKIFASRDAKRCAKIIAIAVMGSSYMVPKYSHRTTIYETDEKRCEELTELFLRTIKPSRLGEIMSYIVLTSNLGDFLNSIRLMCANRTTKPIRVEEKDEA